jgi:hypothetical protein
MQARETSMKLQMLRGTIVSVACQSGAKDRRLGREVVDIHEVTDVFEADEGCDAGPVALSAGNHDNLNKGQVRARRRHSRTGEMNEERRRKTHNDPSPIVTPAATLVRPSISNLLRIKTGTTAMMTSVAAETLLRIYTEII